MKRIVFAMAATAALALCSATGAEKAKAAGETSFAREAVRKYVDSGELPGAISVFYDNGREEIACIGYADAGKKRPITIDDPFMQCSQTKGFCGVTIAILVEEGKLNLDDPVSKYLPEFKTLWVESKGKNGERILRKAKKTLTVRMVMNHTGGFPFELPNFVPMGGWSRRMPLRSAACTAAAFPLLFEPGTRVNYSNIGIDIGAAVVEKITGKRWEDFLAERVFVPLGMKDSTFRPTQSMLERRIQMANCVKGKPARWIMCQHQMQPPFGDDRVFASAGAGLWTTARDQLKFYKMLLNLGMGENGVRILKEETVKSILAQSTRPAGMEGYSLGLGAPEKKKDGENAWFGHGGAWGTSCSMNWRKKQLTLWVVQLVGGPRPWDKARSEAEKKFFSKKVDDSGVKEYTGRLK